LEMENGRGRNGFHGMSEDDVKNITLSFNMFRRCGSIRIFNREFRRGYSTNAKLLSKYVKRESDITWKTIHKNDIASCTKIPAKKMRGAKKVLPQTYLCLMKKR